MTASETSPAKGANTVELPVIDISNPDQKTADELVSAAATYGFVFIKGTGLDVTPDSVRKTFEHAREFFHGPIEEKQKVPMQLDNKGWTSMNEEVLDPATQKKGDPKEAFNFGEFIDGKATQPLPASFAAAESHFAEFYTQCRGVCLKVLRLFGQGLKIDPQEGGAEWFSSRHAASLGPSGTILRLLHYPPTPRSAAEDSIRAGAHSDYGSLTLLFRLPNQPGLEILTPAGTWAPVPVQPPSTRSDPMPPVLLNIGDLLSYWTGGLLKSTVHRVVFPAAAAAAAVEPNAPAAEPNAPGDDDDDDGAGGPAAEERFSLAFFCHPARTTALDPVPSAMVRAKVARLGARGVESLGDPATGARAGRRAVTAEEHLQGRLAATYGWEKEKVVAA